MEQLEKEALRFVYPEHRKMIYDMYNDGAFGAHNLAVKRFLEVEKVSVKEMFNYAEQYVPSYEDLPNEGLANFFKLISTIIRATTPQAALALDAEEYCASEKNSITKNLGDIKQRLVWEHSNELDGPVLD